MKKQTILTVLLVLSVASFAQQAIWGGQNTSSPQINANNTVTFRLDAPPLPRDFIAWECKV